MRTATAKTFVVALAFELVLARGAAAGPPGVGPSGDGPASLALGAGAANRIVTGTSGVAFPLELTLTPTAFLFTSGGLVFSGSGVDYGYAEFGVWFLVSVAGGGGFAAYDSPQGRKAGGAGHVFVGLPIPLDLESAGKANWLPYLEPYYRASWGPWPGTVHEIGFMLKISYWFRDVIGKIGG